MRDDNVAAAGPDPVGAAGPDPAAAAGSDPAAAELSALFQVALEGEPESAVTAESVLRQARADAPSPQARRSRDSRRADRPWWQGWGVIGVAAALVAVLVTVPIVAGGGADNDYSSAPAYDTAAPPMAGGDAGADRPEIDNGAGQDAGESPEMGPMPQDNGGEAAAPGGESSGELLGCRSAELTAAEVSAAGAALPAGTRLDTSGSPSACAAGQTRGSDLVIAGDGGTLLGIVTVLVVSGSDVASSGDTVTDRSGDPITQPHVLRLAGQIAVIVVPDAAAGQLLTSAQQEAIASAVIGVAAGGSAG